MTDRTAKRKIVYLVVALLLTLAAGTTVYHALEGWTWIDALYFSAATITTVGYGDLHVTTDVTKVFTVIYMFIGIAIVVYSLPLMGEYYVERRMQVQKRIEESNLTKLLSAQNHHIKKTLEDAHP